MIAITLKVKTLKRKDGGQEYAVILSLSVLWYFV